MNRGIVTGLFVGGLVGLLGGYLIGRVQTGATAKSNLTPASATSPDPVPVRPSATEPPLSVDSDATREAPATSAVDRLSAALAVKSELDRTNEFHRVLRGISLADIPAVLVWAQNLPVGTARLSALSGIFQRWGELDGKAALAAARQLPPRDRNHTEFMALQGWSTAEPLAAWNAAKDIIKDSPYRGMQVAHTIRALAKTDLARAITEVQSLPEFSRDGLRFSLLHAALDSGTMETAIQLAQTIEPPAERDKWISQSFQRWASLDTDAPMHALKTLGDPGLAQSAMKGLLTGWVELDPMGAATFALENSDDPAVRDAAGTLFGYASFHASRDELRLLADTMVERGVLNTVGANVIPSFASRDPLLAVELAGKLNDPRQRTAVTNQTFTMWAYQDFNSAAAHFDEMAAGAPRLPAFTPLASRALERNEGARVAQWLNGFAGPDRVKAVESLVNSQANRLTRVSPESATAVARAITETADLPASLREQAAGIFGSPPIP